MTSTLSVVVYCTFENTCISVDYRSTVHCSLE